MIDESLKENEALGKRIGNNIKQYLKDENSKYLPSLKQKINEGLKEYYDKLNENIMNELLTQESQQKNLMDQIEDVKTETNKIKINQQRHRDLLLNLKIKNYNLNLKANFIRFLKTNLQNEKRERKLDSQLIYNRIFKMKKSLFEMLKKTTTFKSIKEYDLQKKEANDKELASYENTQIKTKEGLLKLIYEAEEKLKYENKRKIHTKLLLDQIVLRGVSAMNLRALSLSNDSLKGIFFNLDVYKSDYVKDIEKTFHSFNLPKVQGTLTSFK